MKDALICHLSSCKTAIFDSDKPKNLRVWRDNMYLRERASVLRNAFSVAQELQLRLVH
jgi:hypothetical protein